MVLQAPATLAGEWRDDLFLAELGNSTRSRPGF